MNAILWFEIPASDLARAEQFYTTVLNGHIRQGTFGPEKLLLFDVPFNTGEAIGGSIVLRENHKPSADGTTIYLNAFGKLSEAVSKVEAAGGKVLVPFMDLGKFGFAAILLDSEGNKIGLLSHEQ